MHAYVLVGIGGLLGANARYLVSVWAAGRFGTAFPYGTMLINVSGSFLLGLLLREVARQFGDDPDTRLLAGTGFLGAYTTFSTFTYESVALLRQGSYGAAARNVAGNTLLSFAGAALGLGLADLVVWGTR